MARWFAQLRHSKKGPGFCSWVGRAFLCMLSPCLCGFPPGAPLSSTITDEDLDLVCSSLYIRHICYYVGCDFFGFSKDFFFSISAVFFSLVVLFCFVFLALNHFYLHLEEPICCKTPAPTFFPQCSRIVFLLPNLHLQTIPSKHRQEIQHSTEL